MTHAVILTHGSLGKILLEAVETMLGPQESVDVLSNEGQSLDQIIGSVEARLNDSPGILFVDYCGGSPFVACKSLRDRRPDQALISGVNLPMLLSFFTKRARLPFRELVATVENDAHRGIQCIST
ncbi:PTS mannose transporter subunit IIAB [candidate division KSB1 bacterium]|nr:MAG: PTS mannose transporter subunit IIAB [candidate division KSB1 bacterium]